MYVKTQVFFVLGISKSGFAAAEYILKRGGRCFIYEEHDSPRIAEAAEKLLSQGAERVTAEGAEAAAEKSDVLVISPGVPINHPVAVKFKELGKRIMGEAEFGFSQFFPPVAAITGTNGKTTTVTMLGGMLKEAGIDCAAVENIGSPVCSELDKITRDTVCIAEISSFQLESISDFKPHIAMILNISPDHLERHYSMENYIFLKKRLLKNLKESEFAVLNYDDPTVRTFAENLKAKVIWVSARENAGGVYLSGGNICMNGESIVSADAVPVKGEHNLYNAMFAVAAAKLLGADNAGIAAGLKNFRGVPHRVELIAEKNGVAYYDDSKSTNTASAITALRSMTRPTVLILGGSEKGEKYGELFQAVRLSEVKHTVITGASRYNMFRAAAECGVENVTVTADFDSAVRIADMFAEEGDAVLLSPACASFDSFRNFEERGEEFRRLVKECTED